MWWNYSRAETIWGNTVSSLMRNFFTWFFLFLGLDLINSTSGDVFFVNKTFLVVEQTELRSNIEYIQYYILLTNFIFMGIIPSIIMIIFNVLVVRAVNEANQRRARMTRRQQRNITVTSMLVSWKWNKIGILLLKINCSYLCKHFEVTWTIYSKIVRSGQFLNRTFLTS